MNLSSCDGFYDTSWWFVCYIINLSWMLFFMCLCFYKKMLWLHKLPYQFYLIVIVPFHSFITIPIWFDLIRFRWDFSVCTRLVKIQGSYFDLNAIVGYISIENGKYNVILVDIKRSWFLKKLDYEPFYACLDGSRKIYFK